MTEQSRQIPIVSVQAEVNSRRDDYVAIEEPLEIRACFAVDGLDKVAPLAVTMRTPGQDFDLVAGFLHAEGVVRSAGDIFELSHCQRPDEPHAGNIVNALLMPSATLETRRLTRHVFTSSACGVCGKTAIEDVLRYCPTVPASSFVIDKRAIYQLPHQLLVAQKVFEETGGLHAAALVDANGKLTLLREDVGRHNAVDKLIGACIREKEALQNVGLLVSGRASFELVQKAALAGIPMLAAVGAPSSLAVSLAESAGMTLIGFLRDNRFNIYAGAERVE